MKIVFSVTQATNNRLINGMSQTLSRFRPLGICNGNRILYVFFLSRECKRVKQAKVIFTCGIITKKRVLYSCVDVWSQT